MNRPNCLTCSGSLAARKRSANWKNAFSFLPMGFDSLLDEFHQHAIVAEIALPGQGLDLSGDVGRQDSLSDS
ncbi:MAG TPA: hypothetical protein VN948_14300 [Terriglobales bacterium]|nr:hypothetical protein [Terriglobales bacterium]